MSLCRNKVQGLKPFVYLMIKGHDRTYGVNLGVQSFELRHKMLGSAATFFNRQVSPPFLNPALVVEIEHTQFCCV